MRLNFFLSVFLLSIISTFGSPVLKASSLGVHGVYSFHQPDTLLQKGKKVTRGVPLTEPAVPEGIKIDRDASVNYLKKIYSTTYLWKNRQDDLRMSIGELLYDAERPPFDSLSTFLVRYPYDSIRIPWRNFYSIDSVKIAFTGSAPHDTASVRKPREIAVKAGNKTRRVTLMPDNTVRSDNDTIFFSDSVCTFISTIIPSSLPRKGNDTVLYYVTDTLPWVYTLRNGPSPFRRMKYPFTTDTIAAAVKSVVKFLEDRDSTLIAVTGQGRYPAYFWLNSKSGNLRRYWIYDNSGDSATVWIGSPSRNTISIKPEEGVNFEREGWHDKLVDARINTISAKNETLRAVRFNKLKPYSWSYKGDLSLLFSQGMFSNWVSGGNSFYSTAFDLKGYLYYVNKKTQLSWTTTGRLAAGLIKTENVSMRKNLDVIDITSKLNHKAFGKFDFSGQLQFKTQSFPGYNYSTTPAHMTSKFFNPATLIIGYGLDYKPAKNLSINISPLSYKGIYVPDTARIDQTLYGVSKNRKSKNEMGIYTTINSTNTLFNKIKLENKVQLFSNFLHEPQNVDIDWEMTASASLTWYADVKVNTFLIYDDETLTPVYDKKGNPVLDSNGIQKKSPRVQFKELLGLTLAFRF